MNLAGLMVGKQYPTYAVTMIKDQIILFFINFCGSVPQTYTYIRDNSVTASSLLTHIPLNLTALLLKTDFMASCWFRKQ